MKAVVLLTLIGLASCRITLLQDADRDIKVKYSFDDDHDREVEVDFDDRPATILRPLVAPVVQSRPEPVHQFVQVSAAPAPQFRTSVVQVAPPRQAVVQVNTESTPVQFVASVPQAIAQPEFSVVPQTPVFVQERVVPVVSPPRANVVTQYVNAQPVPVVAGTSFVTPGVSAPLITAPGVPIVTPPRATFIEERTHVFRSRDDSKEE